MDEYTVVVMLILLAGAVLLRIWVLVGRGDDELLEPPEPVRTDRNDDQGWAEDEAWDSKRIVF